MKLKDLEIELLDHHINENLEGIHKVSRTIRGVACLVKKDIYDIVENGEQYGGEMAVLQKELFELNEFQIKIDNATNEVLRKQHNL